MTQTIGNPLSWTAKAVGATGSHLAETASGIGSGVDAHPPKVRVLTRDDIHYALRAGWEDMQALRADALCLVAIYPLIGITLIVMSFHAGLIPMIVPLITGFALLGPVASVGLYEMSRRREAGLDTKWSDAFDVLRSPSFGAIAALALYLGVMMLIWMLLAAEIYGATLGPEPPASVAAFIGDVFTTVRGWEMIVLGGITGGVLALTVLAVSVVSFPLLLDRKVGLPVAVVTSVQVTRENPGVILGWGGIVLGALVLGALPFLLGLVIVLPVLGHATWHLYRRAAGRSSRPVPSGGRGGYPATFRTILPIWPDASMRAWALAASAMGNSLSITGAIRPEASSGQTWALRSCAMRALARSLCGRRVDPVIVSRRIITWAKFSSTLGP